MSKVYTEAQQRAKLRSDLATKTLHVLKTKYMGEYQEIYHGLLAEHGLEPTSKTRHTHLIWQENQKLKEKISVMIARGAEVIEFEEDR